MRNTGGFWISDIWEYSTFGYSLFAITKTFTNIQSEYSISIQLARLHLPLGATQDIHFHLPIIKTEHYEFKV